MKKAIDKYTYRVQWSENDKAHICRCMEFSGLQAHGSTPEKAIKECRAAVEVAIEMLTSENRDVPEPFTIKHYPKSFPLRLPDELRRELEIQAVEEEVSLNKLIEKRLVKSG